MPNLGDLLTLYGLAAVFAVILLKEAGLPLPVPGDLIMLLAGIRAAQGELALWQVLLVLLATSLIGASAQFHLGRADPAVASFTGTVVTWASQQPGWIGLPHCSKPAAPAPSRSSGLPPASEPLPRSRPGWPVSLTVPSCSA